MMNMNQAWDAALDQLFTSGVAVAPAGKQTLELQHYTISLDMRRPVLTTPERGLGFRFMAAEAFWILTGDNRVESIAPYSKIISNFSDDGETFFGAYGPKVLDQLPYVVNTLLDDPSSRRAVINIWRENPPETKDYPCTVAMSFMIRDGKLNAHVFMRSNDLWLGTPYDCFNFSMIAHLVCCHLNENGSGYDVEPGALYLTAASSHLYEPQWEKGIAARSAFPTANEPETPRALFRSSAALINELRVLREPNRTGWWHV